MNLTPCHLIVLFSVLKLSVNVAVPYKNLSEIQNILHEVFTETMDVKEAVVSGERSDLVYGRALAAGSSFFHLRKQFTDEQQANLTVNITVGTYLHFLDMQYTALQVLLVKPTDNIVQSIRNRQFPEAIDLLFNLTNYRKRIPEVVHQTYDNSYTNIDALLDFAKALKETDLSGALLSALRYEMHANRHHDPYKLMSLAKALEDEGHHMKPLTNATIQDIIHISSEIFKTSIYSGNQDSERAVQVETLGRAVDAFDPEVSDRFMKHLINETYGHSTVPPSTIADNVYKLKYIPHVAMGLVELFWQMEYSGDLNNVAVFKIADYLKQLREMTTYRNLTIERRLAVDRVIDKLPSCVKQLYFAKSICIWNRGQDEPLYAAIGTYGRPIPGKSMFTWIPKGDPGSQGYWYVEKADTDTFYLRNIYFNNDYLYASLKDYDPGNRFVHAWLRSQWKFELNGDYCYMKSVEMNEYMYVSPAKYDNDRRHVLLKSGTPVKGRDFEWQLSECKE